MTGVYHIQIPYYDDYTITIISYIVKKRKNKIVGCIEDDKYVFVDLNKVGYHKHIVKLLLEYKATKYNIKRLSEAESSITSPGRSISRIVGESDYGYIVKFDSEALDQNSYCVMAKNLFSNKIIYQYKRNCLYGSILDKKKEDEKIILGEDSSDFNEY